MSDVVQKYPITVESTCEEAIADDEVCISICNPDGSLGASDIEALDDVRIGRGSIAWKACRCELLIRADHDGVMSHIGCSHGTGQWVFYFINGSCCSGMENGRILNQNQPACEKEKDDPHCENAHRHQSTIHPGHSLL